MALAKQSRKNVGSNAPDHETAVDAAGVCCPKHPYCNHPGLIQLLLPKMEEGCSAQLMAQHMSLPRRCLTKTVRGKPSMQGVQARTVATRVHQSHMPAQPRVLNGICGGRSSGILSGTLLYRCKRCPFSQHDDEAVVNTQFSRALAQLP